MTSTAVQSQIIDLFPPDAGKTVTVPIRQHTLFLNIGFALDFDKIAKEGRDLICTFEDGGKIRLQGYYVRHTADKTLPIMILENGDLLHREDFLAALNGRRFSPAQTLFSEAAPTRQDSVPAPIARRSSGKKISST